MARFVMMMFLAVAVAEQVCTDEACVGGSSMLVKKTDISKSQVLKTQDPHADAMDPADISEESIAKLEEETRTERHAAEKKLREKSVLIESKRQEKDAEEAKTEAHKAQKKAQEETQAFGRKRMSQQQKAFDDFEKSFKGKHPKSASLLQINNKVWPFSSAEDDAKAAATAKKEEELQVLEAEAKAEREATEKVLKEKEELLQKKREGAAKLKLEKEKEVQKEVLKEEKKKAALAKIHADEEAVERQLHGGRMATLENMEAKIQKFNEDTHARGPHH